LEHFGVNTVTGVNETQIARFVIHLKYNGTKLLLRREPI
jgi:hypothetical protein